MKNTIKYFAAAAFASLALSSCNLDLYPEATVVYDEDKPYFEIASDVDGAHNTVYTYFRSTNGGGYAYYTDIMLQGFNAMRDFGNRLGDLHRADETFNAGSDAPETFWSALYSAINKYNIIIVAADKAKDNETFGAHAQFVKAEALIARADAYLRLARLFGPTYDEVSATKDLCVPLVLVYEQNAVPARESMFKVYEQIGKDLDDALEIFEDEAVKSWVPANEACANYFTKDVIKFLQVRYLLDTKQYLDAADRAADLIASGTYALSSTEAELKAVYENDEGKEAIMQCYASLDELPNSYGVFNGYAQDSNSPTGWSYTPDFIPSKPLIQAYKSDDLRRTCWFKLTGNSESAAPLSSQGSYYGNINLFAKYLGNPALNSAGYANGRVAAKPFMVSELYLIAAEGYLAAGNTSKANQYLQQLQAKRKAATTAANDANIHAEWFRETIGEGLYFSSLKRWNEGFIGRAAQDNALNSTTVIVANREGENNPYVGKVLEPGDKAFCWPIPTYELQCNPNLKQNEGYGSK